MSELLFYDGDCGLCHHTVRFVLWADREGEAFRFAPIDGATYRAQIAPERAAELPDSIVVVRSDGTLLLRSAATVHILRQLGGPWRLLGALLGLVPAGLRDRGYDAIARVRGRLFRTPDSACPLIPPRLRVRFDP